MICPRCGRELERSDGFCPVCDGAEVTRLPVSDDAPTQMSPGPSVDIPTVVPGSATDPSNTPTIVPGPGYSAPADALTRTLLTAAGQTQMTLDGGPTVVPGVGREGLGQHLERHVAAELRVAGLVHLSHSALAEQVADFEGPEPTTGSEFTHR